MKDTVMKYWMTGILTMVFLFTPTPASREDNQQVEETVEIVSVKVPVRVYDKDGRPVKGLTRSDFRLMHDKREEEITAFKEIRRSIRVDRDVEGDLPSRLFVMTFKISEITDKIEEALQYLMNDVFRDGDELMVFLNDSSNRYTYRRAEKDVIYQGIMAGLKKEATAARNLATTYVNRIDMLIRKFKFLLRSQETTEGRMDVKQNKIYQFLREYKQIWEEYKKRYLTHDWRVFANLAQFLSGEKKEKWVLDFFQIESFPRIKENSYITRVLNQRIGNYEASGDPKFQAHARILRRMVQELEMSFQVSEDFFLDKTIPLFYNLEVTFHAFFIPSTQKKFYRDIAYQNVMTDLENALRKLTRVTGGEVLLSGDLKASIEKVETIEDVVYLLFFDREDTGPLGRLKITCANPDYRLAYGEKKAPGFLENYVENLEKSVSGLQISGEFEDRTLSFTVDHVTLDKKENQGKLLVSIRGTREDGGEVVFDGRKALQTREGQRSISVRLPFSKLTAGEYVFAVQIRDMISEEEASLNIKALIR